MPPRHSSTRYVGLQGDAIQPLILRVRQGECLRVRLTNQLSGGEATSLHVHGSALRLAGTDIPATAAEARASVRGGGSVTYEWAVGPDRGSAAVVMV
ncbi:MAG: multicopper oxidase domain-containing protein [Acidimicrobiales bacterium]